MHVAAHASGAAGRVRSRREVGGKPTPPNVDNDGRPTGGQAALAEVLVEGARLGLDPGDAQLLARYERWRSLDTLMVAAATDGLTRLFGLRGKTAASVRRFGLGAVQRIAPLKARFMAEARGESGAMPRLLMGERV